MKTLALSGLFAALSLAAFTPETQAATSITVLGQTVENGDSTLLDFNGDEIADVEARIDVLRGPTLENQPVGLDVVNGLLSGLISVTDPGSIEFDGTSGVGQISSTTFFATESGVQTFVNGDELSDPVFSPQTVLLYSEFDPGIIVAASTASNSIEVPLFPNEPITRGLLPNAGDSAVLGFMIEEGLAELSFAEELDQFVYGPFVGETTRTFGFVEVTRGSIILGTSGYNPTGGAAVVSQTGLAPIPLPASSVLLLAGLGGLCALRRRKVS